jgi:hypothetical protein
MPLVWVMKQIVRCVWFSCTYYSNKKLNYYYIVCLNGVISSVGIWCIYIPPKWNLSTYCFEISKLYL